MFETTNQIWHVFTMAMFSRCPICGYRWIIRFTNLTVLRHVVQNPLANTHGQSLSRPPKNIIQICVEYVLHMYICIYNYIYIYIHCIYSR